MNSQNFCQNSNIQGMKEKEDERSVVAVIENLLVFGEVAELQWSMWGLSGQQNLWMETDRESLRVQPPFQVIMPSSLDSPSTSYLY